MGVRGRKSAAELTVISGNGIEAIRRAEPPAELTDEQAEEWRAIVNTMSADWFMQGNYPILMQYCRHIVEARRISQLIEQCLQQNELDHSHYAKLLTQQQAESRTLADLARSMRLTQHSLVRKETAKHPKRIKKPWADD